MNAERERVAVVTGVAGGVGSALVALLAERGYAVVATDIAPGVDRTIRRGCCRALRDRYRR